jgi:hypothetical protein
LSIDKFPEKKEETNPNVNNFWANLADMINNNRDMIILTIHNLQHLLDESKKVWNGEYIVNPFPIGTYQHAYFEVYIKRLFQKQKNR